MTEKIWPNSETSKCRKRLEKFSKGDGVDLGYAGDPIVKTAITVDLPSGPYGCVFGEHPQNLHGDATKLHWFQDGVLDYVYASHLLEDFTPEEIPKIVEEWLRVVKVGGYVVIYCPDERAYREHCWKAGSVPNAAHKNESFGLKFLVEILEKAANLKDLYEIAHTIELTDDYCFDLVLKKLWRVEWK